MLNNFCVNLTRSTDDPDRATVAMVVATAAVASGKQTMVFLSSEGVHLASKGTAEKINEEGFQSMSTLLQNFLAAGGALWVCSPCFKKRGYIESNLIEGATMEQASPINVFLWNVGRNATEKKTHTIGEQECLSLIQISQRCKKDCFIASGSIQTMTATFRVAIVLRNRLSAPSVVASLFRRYATSLMKPLS